MFVAKYPNWLTQVRHESGSVQFFDGVKDMLAYYLNPKEYGAAPDDTINEIWVKGYYSLSWIEGKQAIYVQGSDVYGPMGHEFIPFASQVAAESFMKDHKGKNTLSFDEISFKLVESMRSGHKMR